MIFWLDIPSDNLSKVLGTNSLISVESLILLKAAPHNDGMWLEHASRIWLVGG
jgi:hypothetical protein